MADLSDSPSKFEVKIYIDDKGDVTITSLFKELLPLLNELSPFSGGEGK